jgi:protein TonB
MSYLDQSRRRNPASVAAVIGVHMAVGYTLLVGLGYTVIPRIPNHTTIFTVPTEPPPPQPKPVETQRDKQSVVTNPIPKPDDSLKADPTPLPQPNLDGPIGTIGGGDGKPVPIPSLDPVRPSQAAGAVPERNWRNWITTDDYPTAALRQEVQGTVIISVMIGTDGRVRSCLVTQSSGSKLLDDATCRLYTQRARFTPARDADGNPVPAQRTDRYRWQIPNE